MVWHGAEAGGLVDVDATAVLRRNPAGYEYKRQCHQYVRSHGSPSLFCGRRRRLGPSTEPPEKGRMLIAISWGHPVEVHPIEAHPDSGTTAILKETLRFSGAYSRLPRSDLGPLSLTFGNRARGSATVSPTFARSRGGLAESGFCAAIAGRIRFVWRKHVRIRA